MSIWRAIGDKIELYNPTTGEPILSYNETDDEIDANNKPIKNASAVETEDQ